MNKNRDTGHIDLGEHRAPEVKLSPKRGKRRAAAALAMLAGVVFAAGADKPITAQEAAASAEVKREMIAETENRARTELALKAANRLTCDIQTATDYTARGEQPQRIDGKRRGRVEVVLSVGNNPAFAPYREAYNASDEKVWGSQPRIRTVMLDGKPLTEHHFDFNEMEVGSRKPDSRPEDTGFELVKVPETVTELRPLVTNAEGRTVALVLVQPVNKKNLDGSEETYLGGYPCSNGLVKHDGEWQPVQLDPANTRPFVITGQNPGDVMYGERQPS